MSKNEELWLMVKDSQSKKIRNHVKFDVKNYIQNEFNDVYNYIGYAINYATKYIDDKNFAIIKKSMEYDLAGIKEMQNAGLMDSSNINVMLYSFEGNLSKLVEYVNKTLDYDYVNLADLSPVIGGILEARCILDDFSKNQFHTKQQQLLIDTDIANIIHKFNNKIQWQINNIKNKLCLQNCPLPPWFALHNTINAIQYINSIQNLQINIIEEIQITEK